MLIRRSNNVAKTSIKTVPPDRTDRYSICRVRPVVLRHYTQFPVARVSNSGVREFRFHSRAVELTISRRARSRWRWPHRDRLRWSNESRMTSRENWQSSDEVQLWLMVLSAEDGRVRWKRPLSASYMARSPQFNPNRLTPGCVAI